MVVKDVLNEAFFREAEAKGERIRLKLKGCLIGERVFWFDETDSTNDLAYNLYKEVGTSGLVVLATRQRKGRGRKGEEWFSPAGGVWLSIALKPIGREKTGLLPLAMGVAVCKVLREKVNVEAEVKWPNDVLINGRKVSGVLVENKFMGEEAECTIIGVGVNLNFERGLLPEFIRGNATTVMDEVGSMVDFVDFTVNLLREIDRFYSLCLSGEISEIMNLYTDFSCLIGKCVEVHGDGVFKGLVQGFNGEGALILIMSGGKVVKIKEGSITKIF